MAQHRTIDVVGAAILRGGRCLVAQRGPRMSQAGKWEFPGGKVERAESRRAALVRELREELALDAEIGAWLGRGESRNRGRRVRLDVYEVATWRGTPKRREHARVEWIAEPELGALDFSDADVPALPAVRARLRAAPDVHRLSDDVTVVSADWAKPVRKRAVRVARLGETAVIARAEPPPGGWSLGGLVDLAVRLRARGGRAVLIAIDASLGVPTAFARRAGVSGFLDCLRGLERAGALERECASPEDWSPRTPFFRVPPGAGGLTRFVDAAGGRSALLRQIELRTQAKPVFALSGIPGTVGSGSRALWSELAPRLEDPEREFSLWPFEGDLAALAAEPGIVLADAYPRAAYSVALEEQLPAPLARLGKTRESVRVEALARLREAAWVRRCGVVISDEAHARASEDDFDALLTAAALVRLVRESRPLSCELVDPTAEGGILATGAIEFREPR